MSGLSNENECFICKNALKINEKKVTTECGHIFHRHCAQKYYDEKHKSACVICKKSSALVNALQEQKTTITTTSSTRNSDKPVDHKDKTRDTGVAPKLTSESFDKNKKANVWSCEYCTLDNSPSTDRCDACGALRHAATTTQREKSVVYPRIDMNDGDFQSNEESKRYHRSRDHKERKESSGEENQSNHRKTTVPKTAPDSRSTANRKEEISTASTSDTIVYIPDLPVNIADNEHLEELIRQRIEKVTTLKVGIVKCYPKLGVGLFYVGTNVIKDQFIRDIGHITLDPSVGKNIISFTGKLEIISYVVVEIDNEKKDLSLPTTGEIRRRWMEIYQGEISCLCEPLHIEFPNIYRVISRSLDELLKVIKHSDFTVNDLLAQIYLRASCSFFENLSESITEDQLRKAVCKEIQEPNITSTSLYVQLNKQTHNASVITTNETRIWSITNHLLINGIVFPKKNKLTCRLCIYPIPSSYNIQKILKHEEFQGKILNYKHQGASLILELSDEVFFNECVTLGAIRISDSERFRMGTYVASHKTDSNEIDEDTWYKTGMSRYKPDIMQFISDPNHEIFQYKWNSQIWLKQFNQTIDENNNEKQMRDRRHTPSDITRHQLRVTAMLNTLAVIRKKSYMIHDRHFQLDVDKNMKTIIYDQRSMLEQGGKLPITKPPYRETRVEVFNEDCLVVYERLVKQNYKPLLLNMANASNPGGGYRKGDGAQEENLFRRSDYFRSLDVGLDQWLSKRSARYHCSSNCQLDPLSNHNSMYPMHEYGAIYTSGLTVFRQAENTGYSFMEEPLKNVCSLAVAAYRDPKLDGNMLAQKFAVGTRKKIENIFAIAFHHKHDSLVLSALGCGAFKNPPGHVAELFLSVIEQYAGFFKLITFAILDDHNSGRFFNPNGNFRPFQTLLNGITVTPLSPMNTSLTIFGPYRLLSDGLSTDDVCICDKPLCKFGATCIDLHNRKHVKEYSHPPHCPHAATKGQCKFTDNIVHMKSFVHRTQCRYGGECREINDEKHTQEFEHPVNCPDGSKCVDIGDKHLKQYRHLPLCPEGLQCLKFKMYDQSHCDTLRHCALNCPFGNNCGYIHDKQHQDRYVHPVPPTCPFTPFNCKLYTKFLHSTDCNTLDDDILNHCLDLAHICPLGRNCQDKSKLHLEKAIHIPRYICSDGNTCTELTNEDHLNTFTHVKILDIRKLCKYADECFDRRKVEHVTEYRHAARFEHSGILSVFNLNSGIDFVENQKNIIERIIQYVKDQNWTPLPSWTIPDDILNWIRTVQPVHRCNQVIFESILLHGHVMSREYMLNLKTPQFVANSVLHHSRIRRISDLQEKVIGEKAKAYIIALVQHYFTSKGFISGKIPDVTPATPVLPVDTHDELTSLQIGIEESEKYLSAVLKEKDLEAIRIKSNEIAEASINLHTNRAGIGYSSDKDLGTDKTVFSILGPHLGHYYGDIFIVFKRDILHHPDANFTIQAATSIISGNAFKLRPWLGTPVTDKEKLIELFNSCKLNCSIPGYEYAAALELIAFTSQHFGLNSMNITLDKIIERWFNVDSHLTIEGHLPQLIPLSYIEHIYIPQNLYNLLSRTSQKTMNATFRNSFTVVPYDGIPIQPQNPHGPTPPTKSREDFQNFVVEELRKKFIERVQHPSWTSIQGAAITMPFADFTKTYLLPLTISQAYKQYRYANRRQPKDETYYIYWQVVGGDMILTLSNESILSKGRKSNLQCLSCYIAGKGSLNDTTYHEYYSYVNDSAPFQHLVLREQNKFAAKSNQFFVGCNTDYLMTFCLEIQFSIGMVILSHAGPNSIYNHEKISFTFDKSRLDLQVLEFIHISCGSRTVPVRNLIVCFEKQTHLHPTFDKDFSTISSVSSKEPIHLNILPKKVVKKTDLIPCRDNVNCLLQHSKRYGPAHNVTYSHPCLFSELCTTKEAHLTHESHNAPKCKYDKKCKEINDPFHRVEYRHTNLPDFLIPCRHQNACYNDSFEHRIEFSHGEQVYKKSDSSPQSK